MLNHKFIDDVTTKSANQTTAGTTPQLGGANQESSEEEESEDSEDEDDVGNQVCMYYMIKLDLWSNHDGYFKTV